VTFNFPSLAPVDDENMNYTSAAIGVIALVGIGTWVVSARKGFTGPVDMVHGVGRSTEGEPSAYGDGAAVGCDGKPQG
jgi:steroid 5-alpha reductase family enzyme